MTNTVIPVVACNGAQLVGRRINASKMRCRFQTSAIFNAFNNAVRSVALAGVRAIGHRDKLRFQTAQAIDGFPQGLLHFTGARRKEFKRHINLALDFRQALIQGFPLIGVNGSYYRMMTSPRSVSSSLLGASLGTIAEYTTEPSLSGTNVMLSNKAAVGTEVYGISGMSSTFVAAEVDGQMRLFQRVSFNGNALKGSETLADVMQLSGHVASIELSGVGTITDTSVCADLISLLLNDATYESSGSLSAKQSLLIELDNGLVYQFTVKNDKIASCGTWSCPEFFEAFEAACE